MSDPDIHELDDRTVEQIAAGEVVERPASAVKELVENSLDADAEQVDVTVEAGGTERIAVADDGHGMSEAAVRQAVRQHTTSKISGIEDLEAGVSTLGFRGEALSTIGAVSRMTITTRPRGADTGTRLEMAGGEVQAVDPAGRAPGTTVEVTDLFYNTPARRKFLKAESTEFGHVNRVVTRYALANPDVAVSLTHGDRETFATTGQGDRRGAIMAVYGRDVAESMREVDRGGEVSVHGYVSDPETTRSTREYLATYVNGRYVTDSALREAILSAYGTQLAPDRFPFAVLFVEVPPGGVDVNVHPRKTAVRFDDESAVREAVTEAVADALLDEGLVRSGAPRGRSAPDEATVEPERPSDDADAKQGAATEDRTESGATDANRRRDAENAKGRPAAASRTPETDSADDDSESDADRRFAATENATLPGLDDAPDDDFDRLPSMDVLGQLDDTYLVAAAAGGLVVIDQHAADERVNYERLRDALGDGGDSQALVRPVTLELTAAEAAVFDDLRPALSELGFEADLDGREAVVTAVPAVFDDALDPALLRDVLASALSAAGDDPVADAADALLADLACYPSITGNTSLSEGSAVALLSALDDCENPFACPHGRPVVVEVSADELADRFERDYPGHQHRRPE
ncbi:MAG: DNA mismatch repair endonuclease MutL [Halobacteriaceae archaeon]